MTERKKDDNRELRQKAEHLIAQTDAAAEDLTGMSPQQIAGLVHELRVHQVELKMQNDELRRIQTELEKARDRYLHLYDFAPTAYFTVDEKGVVAEANLTAATLLERPRKALVGTMFSRFIHRDDQDIWYLHRKRLLETGNFQSPHVRLVKSGGAFFYVNLECMLAKESGSERKVIRIAATDVTCLKQAEQALRHSNATLEQRVAERTAEVGQRALQLQRLALEMSDVEDRERRRFAVILHDDLQQRLASLRFKIWDIVPRDKADERVEDKIKELEADIAESIKISRSLSLDLSPPVLHQNGLIAALGWLAKDIQSRHSLSVALNADKQAEPETAAMASVLFRTVNELLFNVVKHSGARSAQVDAAVSGNQIVISVSDSGKGFDEVDFKARQAAGDTFGLFSIKERISFLGGSFSIESSPGAGCRATLSVPKGETALSESIKPPSDARNALPPPSDRRLPAAGGIRIVIADDHPMMREGLARLLTHRDGLEVIGQAGNGRQAISLASELNPDLILMDVSMPELDGIQATAQIRRAQPNICIVGLSMHDDQTTRERMLAAGAADHLCKSSPTQDLIESIIFAVSQYSKR